MHILCNTEFSIFMAFDFESILPASAEVPPMNGIGTSRRTLCRAIVAAALPTLVQQTGLHLAAAQAEESSMPRPLVPLSTTVDQWDHHWFLWLPHHDTFESVEVASREPDRDGRVAIWVWFTE